MISANLIGKCLLIGGAGAATGTGIYFIQKSYFSYNKELKELAEKVGLICEGNPTETSGVECTKKEGADVKVKKDTDLDVSAITGGKIKVYLKSKDEEYNKDFKFVIEDGDISTSVNDKKLEQFETYEIKEDPKETWKLNRKSDAKAEIKKALGLPSENTCDLPTNNEEKTCNLDATKLKNINFEGKTKEMEVVNVDAGGAAESLSLKMKMMTATDAEKSTFPHGYKFTLVSNRDIKLGGDKSIKKDTNTEFKIKVTPATGGPKVLTLEKAWSVVELGKKVGLECLEGGKKECTLKDGSINVNNGTASETDKKFTGLTKKNNADDKKVKYEENVGDHNQGIKFFVDGEADIELQNGTGSGNDTDKKILKKNGTTGSEISYEILKESSSTTWHLTKKTTAVAA